MHQRVHYQGAKSLLPKFPMGMDFFTPQFMTDWEWLVCIPYNQPGLTLDPGYQFNMKRKHWVHKAQSLMKIFAVHVYTLMKKTSLSK